jgi:tetratricopeptide (TPR) repeat protein
MKTTAFPRPIAQPTWCLSKRSRAGGDVLSVGASSASAEAEHSGASRHPDSAGDRTAAKKWHHRRMSVGPRIVVPDTIRGAFDGADFDVVAEWLLTMPTDAPWPQGIRDMAVTIAEIFLTINPQVSGAVLEKLVNQDTIDIHILLLCVDAAGRRGDQGAARELVAPIRDYMSVANLDRAEKVAILNNVGTFLKGAGAFDAAEQTLDDALDLCDSSTVDEERRVLINLATVFSDRVRARGGDTAAEESAALGLLDRAERLGGDDPAGFGAIWFNRGHIHAVAGRGAQAAKAYDEAERYFGGADAEPYDLAYLERARAADAGRNGRVEDSVRHYTLARDYFKESGDLDEAVATSASLILARHLSQEPLADGELDELLELVRQTRPASVGDLLVNIGNVLMDRDYHLASERFLDAEHEFAMYQRPVDVERARHSRAVMIRRLGDPVGALAMLREVRKNYESWGLTTKVAEADFNIAVAMRDLDEDSALDRALAAFDVLDRNRHELATAADRVGTRRVTYKHLLDLTLELALRAGDVDLVAALAERARTQTMLAPGRVDGSEQLAPPAPVRARPDAAAVPGDGIARTLSEITESIGGDGSAWLTWATYRDRLLRVVVTATATHVSEIPFPTELLTVLDDATSIQLRDSRAGVGGPAEMRRAQYRIATGPILNDPVLASKLRASLPPSFTAEPENGRPDAEVGTLFECLADALIPEAAWAAPSLVLAPPSYLGHVPWAALERDHLWCERTDLTLVPPVSTMRDVALAPFGDGPTAWIADSAEDLVYCRGVLEGWQPVVGAAATTHAVLGALTSADRVIVRGHIRPGTPERPRTAAIRLADGELTADDLEAALGSRMPREWVLLGCDAAGASTGDEWSGLPIGLGSAGAEQVIVTQWPIVDCAEQEALDLELIDTVDTHGLSEGLRRWQRSCARRWKQTRSPEVAPHRWAGHCLVNLVTGRP